MTIALRIFLLAILWLPARAQINLMPIPDYAGKAPPPLSLNGYWLFSSGSQGTQRSILVPGEWELQGFNLAPTDTAFYQLSLPLPPQSDDLLQSGYRPHIRFEGVSSFCIVSLNGQELARHEGGFTSFDIDLTPAMAPGKNILKVAVMAHTISDILSSLSQYAGHTVGGILRDVHFFWLPPFHCKALDYTTRFSPDYRQATIDISILSNPGPLYKEIGVRLVDREGQTVAGIAIVGPEARSSISLQVTSPRLWSPEDPYLYELVIEMPNLGQQSEYRRKIGLRDIKLKGNRLLVNGSPVKLHGINRHDTHPIEGRAFSASLTRRDLELFRQANCNFIRSSHYPPSKALLDAADELGFFVESEAALCWMQHPSNHNWKKLDYRDEQYLPYMINANLENIAAGRLHPSVILWSLGNESYWSPLWEKVMAEVKKADTTRPCAFHDQCWGDYNNGGSRADIAVYHYPNAAGPARCDSNQSRPTFFGEFALLPNYSRRELVTDPAIHSHYGPSLARLYDSMYVHDGCLGGAIWSGIDDIFHLPDGRFVGYGPWGAIDAWRRPKPEYWGLKKAFAPVLIKNLQHAKPENGILSLELENRYDFTDLKDVEIRIKTDGRDTVIPFALAPHSRGELKMRLPATAREIFISFRDPRGFICNEERIVWNEEKTPMLTNIPVSVNESANDLRVRQGEFEWVIRKQDGTISSLRKNETEIIGPGPLWCFVPLNREDGGKPNLADETYQNQIPTLRNYPMVPLFTRDFTWSRTDSGLRVATTIVFKEGQAIHQYLFTQQGLLKMDYAVQFNGPDSMPRQYGLLFQLPKNFDRLSWKRKGEFSTYPSDQIDRLEGSARLNARNSNSIEEYRKIPSLPWKDDANEFGSRDFRATRRGLLEAMLENGSHTGIKIISNGHQALRTWLQDERIQALVADYDNNGTYSIPFAVRRIVLKREEWIKGSLILSPYQLSDSMIRHIQAPWLTIGAARDGSFTCKGAMQTLSFGRMPGKGSSADSVSLALIRPDPIADWDLSRSSNSEFLSRPGQVKAIYQMPGTSVTGEFGGSLATGFGQGWLEAKTDTGFSIGREFIFDCSIRVETPNSEMVLVDYGHPARQEYFSLKIKDERIVVENGGEVTEEYWTFKPGYWFKIRVICKQGSPPRILINGEDGPMARARDQITLMPKKEGPPDPLTLWYRQPAKNWQEALVLGNGRLGAMVMGGVADEVIYLNHDELWSGGPRRLQNPKAISDLRVVRQLLNEGKAREASDYANAHLLMPYNESYLPMGMIQINFPISGMVKEYQRRLDLNRGEAVTEFVWAGVRYTRRIISSQPGQCLAIRLEANSRGALNCKASLKSLLPHQIRVMGKTLSLSGRAPMHTDPHYLFSNNVMYSEGPDGEGMRFEMQLKAMNDDGQLIINESGIEVKNASGVTLMLVAATSFKDYKTPLSVSEAIPNRKCLAQWSRIGNQNYQTLWQNHLTDYSRLFNRVQFSLGGNEIQRRLPTDERIKNYQPGQDNQLAALYMQFGRYLLIASSRAGTQPANLQGIWNKNMNPSWSSNYTLNCNTEINYWPVEVANLSECHEPLLRMVEELVDDGRRTAKLVYGTRGWVVHHNTDLWRTATPVDGDISWAMFPAAGAWLCQHLWEHYAFNNDTAFLRRVWPVLREAAVFYIENLQRHPRYGWLVTSPDVNFENFYRRSDGVRVSAAMGPTPSMMMIRELFGNCIRVTGILKTDSVFGIQLAGLIPQLPPLQIDPRSGELQEWLEPQKHADRDVAMLLSAWGLICSNQVDPATQPELARAIRLAFDNRMPWQKGVVGSWQGAFQSNVYARLKDGDTALAVISKHLQTIVNPNLTADFIQSDWEIDGNLGQTAAICEMLLQSQGSRIELLPALPKAWPDGLVKGLKARGNITVDISWKDGQVIQYQLKGKPGQKVKVRVNGKDEEIILK